MLEALIQQHAGMVTRYGPGGVTPLMIATLHGHKDAVLRVMPRLPINEVDLGGNTALHYAARAGDAEILGWLLYNGADFSVPNKCGETPLDLARSFEHEQCVQTLQVRGLISERLRFEPVTHVDCCQRSCSTGRRCPKWSCGRQWRVGTWSGPRSMSSPERPLTPTSRRRRCTGPLAARAWT